MTNPYEALGVPKDATKETIKRAYRKKAQKVHPDKVGDAGKEEFQKISSAYALLCDDTARARYDSSGRTEPADDNLAAELANLMLSAVNKTSDVEYYDVIEVMRRELNGQRSNMERQRVGVEAQIKKLERAAVKVKSKKGEPNLLSGILLAEAGKGKLLIGQINESTKRIDALLERLKTYTYEVSQRELGAWHSTSTFFSQTQT